MQILQACNLFRSEDKNNKSFQFLHCWRLLRNQQKWMDRSSQSTSQITYPKSCQKRQKTTPNSSPCTSTPITPDDCEVATPDHELAMKQTGRTCEKEKSQVSGDIVYVEVLGNMSAQNKEAVMIGRTYSKQRRVRDVRRNQERSGRCCRSGTGC
jgi:hypothetical protein